MILRELGSGQFGQVWVALLRPEAREVEQVEPSPAGALLGVAVKMSRSASPESIRNLKNETQVFWGGRFWMTSE